MSRVRDMVDCTQISRPTQGSIFNFAHHEDYPSDEILGLLITARCDIANDKADKFSYLPTIPLGIWCKKELPAILKARESKSVENQLNTYLKKTNLTTNSVKIYGFNNIRTVFNNQLGRKDKEKGLEKLDRYEALTKSSDHHYLKTYFEKEIELIFKDIIKNKHMSYFFIDEIGSYGPCITNLREVSHMDSNAAKIISGGIELHKLTDRKSPINCINNIDPDGIACLIGQLRSPYIELLMQRFAENFTRIGIDDPSDDLISSIATRF
ncbi:hypothetical protein GCM10009113_11880 [Marinobacter szutsaonensis]